MYKQIHLVILVSKDGASVPIAAYENADRALLHVESANREDTDEAGFSRLSSAGVLDCFATIQSLRIRDVKYEQ